MSKSKKWRHALIVVATSPVPLTSRELAARIGIDYRRNFNKRERRYARRLTGFVVRRRPAANEIANCPNSRHNRWFLADQWKGHRVIDIAKALLAKERAVALPPIRKALPPAPPEAINA